LSKNIITWRVEWTDVTRGRLSKEYARKCDAIRFAKRVRKGTHFVADRHFWANHIFKKSGPYYKSLKSQDVDVVCITVEKVAKF